MSKFKRTLSIVLALTMLITSISVCATTVFAEGAVEEATNEIVYWDGTAVAPTKGEGTKANPYIIENAMHFSWALHESDAANAVENIYFSLNSDIYLNDISKINWSTGEVEDGYEVNSWTPAYFSGIIEGNGHTVYGMYINNNPTEYIANNKGKTGAGLLSDNYWNRAVTITGLGMDNVYIHHGEVAAVFVARQDCNNNAAL